MVEESPFRPKPSPSGSHHTQCLLVKGTTHTYAWIPSTKAKKGRYLKLKGESGWEDGWQVRETYSTRPTEEVLDRESDYRYQRQASDV